MKSDIWIIFENLSIKFFVKIWERVTGSLLEDQFIFWSYLAQFFLEWEIFKSVVDKIKTHFIFNNFFSENPAVYGIIGKTIVEADRPQMSTKYGSCALHAGFLRLHTHSLSLSLSGCVILIAFPLHLRVTFYVHCMSCCFFGMPG